MNLKLFTNEEHEKIMQTLASTVPNDHLQAQMVMAKVMEHECRMQDQAFELTGTEQEELEENLMFYMKDPEV